MLDGFTNTKLCNNHKLLSHNNLSFFFFGGGGGGGVGGGNLPLYLFETEPLPHLPRKVGELQL